MSEFELEIMERKASDNVRLISSSGVDADVELPTYIQVFEGRRAATQEVTNREKSLSSTRGAKAVFIWG